MRRDGVYEKVVHDAPLCRGSRSATCVLLRPGLPRAFAFLLRHSEIGEGYAAGRPAARAHSAFMRCRENLRALRRYGGPPHPEVVLRGNWATGVKYQPQGVESSVAFSQV